MRSCFLLIAFVCLFIGRFATALPAASRPPVIPAPAWLPPGPQSQSAILQDLTPKAGMPPYGFLLKRLTFAQKNLQGSALNDRRAGIDAAYAAALIARSQANDPVLTARIFDAFLLPFIPVAHPEAAYQTSRQSLLKAAFTAYQESGQEDKEIETLTLLRYYSADDNTHDWACVQLAPLYVHRENYQKAIDALKAIRTTGMKGAEKYIPALEQKLKDQQEKSKKQAGNPALPAKSVKP